MKDKHVIEALGMTRVVIENGKVTKVGTPQLSYCPLFNKNRGIEELTPEIVQQNIEFRIKDFGMCTSNRQMRMTDFLHFGISETLCMALLKGMLDCSVLVCDGAGTVVVSDPDLIQGIGGRISGIVETSPIPEVIYALDPKNVLDVGTAKIDQVEGVRKAFELGYKRVAVTVASVHDAVTLRKEYGSRIVILMVHTTGITKEEAKTAFETCDIITACASKWLRLLAEDMALVQAGNKVPVYAASPIGEIILRIRMEDLKIKPMVGTSKDSPRPLI
jgi:putative methanogenesis marker protein 8